MSNLLYLIAVILVIGWVLGFFVYSAGALIHALLVLAIIAILINIIRGRAV
ncbi:lmo0937 family membrane protein [Chitinophaga varians]|uniref:Lmo0937 family membrane protein n=1 Tax=Chitinophaga varians TaxID=2202339 RepID=A0A847RVA8_9BACT|nr:lmo0937 family membrane protein [Chitinophaga varians]NLR64818.1 lmo0937 family membrane protein [Chitinophaga varians]